MTVCEMQNLNRKTMEYVTSLIRPGTELRLIREQCEQYMLSNGADSFWYWDVGAFIFSGEDTVLSVSGREYKTASRIIGENDIITVDLSPQRNSVWGDFARTIIVEDGAVVTRISDIKRQEWKNGLLTEDILHGELIEFATPETTFEELYFHINQIIVQKGFVNLDFLGNLGHSVAEKKADRIYIEKGNQHRLGDVKFFTFEPHISIPGTRYGYKKEDIYSFVDGRLKAL